MVQVARDLLNRRPYAVNSISNVFARLVVLAPIMQEALPNRLLIRWIYYNSQLFEKFNSSNKSGIFHFLKISKDLLF